MRINASTIIVTLYLLHFVFPYFGVADKNDNSNLYLTALNILSVVRLYFHKELFKKVGDTTKLLPVFIFICFFFWSVITILPAINLGYAFAQLTFYFTQLLSFIFIIIYLKDINIDLKKYVQFIVVFFTIIELGPTLYIYTNDIIELGKPLSRKLSYRGITGNVNILAFSLLLKLPLIYYFYLNSKFRLLNLLLMASSFFVIIQITKTRGAILSLILISIFLVSYSIYLRLKEKKSKENINRLSKTFLFIFSLLSMFILDNYLENKVYKTSTASINRISSLADDDFSANSRIRYYTQAIKSIIKNPILGIGVGNWEVVGVDKDSKNIDAYIVPFHVHNDYLEIAAESGLIGGFLYFFMILYVLYLLLRRVLRSSSNKNDNVLYFTLVVSLTIYLMDAFLNFPSARFLQQTNLFFILAVSIIFIEKDIYKIKFKRVNLLVASLLFIIPSSTYSTIRLYNASNEHGILLSYFNSTGKMPLDKDFIDNVEYKYPSLSVTTIPVQSIKGIWYYNKGEIDTAITLLRDGIKYNPFISVSDAFIGKIYLDKEINDSALYYTRKAFKNIPNNDFHLGLYYESLARFNDSLSIKEVYQIPKEKTELRQRLYLEAMNQVLGGKESSFAFKDVNLPISSQNEAYMQGFYSLKVGRQSMYAAAAANLLGQKYFNEMKFNLALESFRTAYQNNPYEVPYFENLTNTLIQLNMNEEALELIEEYFIKNNELSNKLLYIKSLALLSLNNIDLACIEFKKLKESLYIPEDLYYNFCN
jgi:O-antigen ligase